MIFWKCVKMGMESGIKLDDLPIEILTQIAVADYGGCYREMLAVPRFGRFALENRDWLYQQMTMEIQYRDGGRAYKLFGKLHRGDGPAEEHANGNKCWWWCGVRHRDETQPCATYPTGTGPAIELVSGYKSWWLYGEQYMMIVGNEKIDW